MYSILFNLIRKILVITIILNPNHEIMSSIKKSDGCANYRFSLLCPTCAGEDANIKFCASWLNHRLN